MRQPKNQVVVIAGWLKVVIFTRPGIFCQQVFDIINPARVQAKDQIIFPHIFQIKAPLLLPLRQNFVIIGQRQIFCGDEIKGIAGNYVNYAKNLLQAGIDRLQEFLQLSPDIILLAA